MNGSRISLEQFVNAGLFDAENNKTKYESLAVSYGNLMKPISNCKVRLMDSLAVQQLLRVKRMKRIRSKKKNQ